MPVLLPLAPRVCPVVQQCTVPVQSNIRSESKLYTSNTDLGKLSCLSCPKINIITVPCVYPGGMPPVFTPVLPIVPVAKFPAPVADLTAPSDLSASAEPFVPQPFCHHPYKPDCLDDLIQTTSQQFSSSSNWGDFIRTVGGRGDLHSDIANIPHPAAHLLSRFQKVDTPAIMSGKPWSEGQIKAALKQGPYSSSKDGIKFLRNEFANMVKKQQWIILPANMIKKMFGFCLSPIGLVPQANRRACMISDYSYFDFNADTLNIAPAKKM